MDTHVSLISARPSTTSISVITSALSGCVRVYETEPDRIRGRVFPYPAFRVRKHPSSSRVARWDLFKFHTCTFAVLLLSSSCFWMEKAMWRA